MIRRKSNVEPHDKLNMCRTAGWVLRLRGWDTQLYYEISGENPWGCMRALPCCVHPIRATPDLGRQEGNEPQEKQN